MTNTTEQIKQEILNDLENTYPDLDLFRSVYGEKPLRLFLSQSLDRIEAETRKGLIKEIYSEVIGNGSHDRSSIIHMLTHKYKAITGIDIPSKYNLEGENTK